MSEVLWQPDPAQAAASRMGRFLNLAAEYSGRDLRSYADLHRWSVEDLEGFWKLAWEFVELQSSAPYSTVLQHADRMPGAVWFPGARLNFAENLLRFRDERTALVFYGEDQIARRLTYAELFEQVERAAHGLRSLGVTPGDRVVGLMPNMPETVITMLAAVALGAVWSSCSPDFGLQGVLDRFGQIQPRVLVSADGYFFKGKRIALGERVAEIVDSIPSIQATILVPYAGPTPAAGSIRGALSWEHLLRERAPIVFAQRSFQDPVYIMYSSGTTGLPKCMVQGPGVLLNHLKEHVLHTDVGRDDVVFYFTTCGWMMWNWLVSGLATGSCLVLFDGNPFHPDPGVLWRIAAEEGITVFGTSARYLRAVEEAGLVPRTQFDLTRVRSVLSTGSPLAPEQFDWVYASLGDHLQLASISGGTDLNGCFALGSPLLPVRRGELQCRGLGMAVEVFDEQGKPVREAEGELVCTRPFPSMPLYFWDDADGARYRRAYFERFPGVWCHGDFALLTESDGMVVLGRSDATLNAGGVRIGTADLYSVLESLPALSDSVAIGQAWGADVRVVLFVVLAPGFALDDELRARIRTAIRERLSPRHVPAKILSVPEVPYTLNMKKVELAVKRVVEGKSVTNRDALRNPDSLVHFANRPELAED